MPGFIPWRKVDVQLQAQRSIWISTTRPDGRPHVVPVWFIWDGTRATIFLENCDLYRVQVKHIMIWEYGNAGTCTDWNF